MKICTRCKIEKSLTEFNFKIKSLNKLSAHCKECSRSYIKNHYNNNKDYYLKKARKRNLKIRDEVREFVRQYLKKHPCVDCGEEDILVLEFDHLHDKLLSISKMISGYNHLEQVKLEIAKCEVRCANCHRRKTAKQFGWFRYKLPL